MLMRMVAEVPGSISYKQSRQHTTVSGQPRTYYLCRHRGLSLPSSFKDDTTQPVAHNTPITIVKSDIMDFFTQSLDNITFWQNRIVMRVNTSLNSSSERTGTETSVNNITVGGFAWPDTDTMICLSFNCHVTQQRTIQYTNITHHNRSLYRRTPPCRALPVAHTAST